MNQVWTVGKNANERVLRSTSYHVNPGLNVSFPSTINNAPPIKLQRMYRHSPENFFYNTMRNVMPSKRKTKSRNQPCFNTTCSYRKDDTLIPLTDSCEKTHPYQTWDTRKYQGKIVQRAKSMAKKKMKERVNLEDSIKVCEDVYSVYLNSNPIKLRPRRKKPIDLEGGKSTTSNRIVPPLSLKSPVQKINRFRQKYLATIKTEKPQQNDMISFRGSTKHLGIEVAHEREDVLQAARSGPFSRMPDEVKPLFFFNLNPTLDNSREPQIGTPSFMESPRGENEDMPKPCSRGDTKEIMREINKKMGLIKANIYVNKTKIVNNIIGGGEKRKVNGQRSFIIS